MGGEQELLVYARLTRYLNPDQPFYGLRARGVDDLVEPHESVEAMAAEHLEEIRKVQPTRPVLHQRELRGRGASPMSSPSSFAPPGRTSRC